MCTGALSSPPAGALVCAGALSIPPAGLLLCTGPLSSPPAGAPPPCEGVQGPRVPETLPEINIYIIFVFLQTRAMPGAVLQTQLSFIDSFIYLVYLSPSSLPSGAAQPKQLRMVPQVIKGNMLHMIRLHRNRLGIRQHTYMGPDHIQTWNT